MRNNAIKNFFLKLAIKVDPVKLKIADKQTMCNLLLSSEYVDRIVIFDKRRIQREEFNKQYICIILQKPSV